MNKKIIISFSITIFLLILLGAMSILKMTELSNLTQKMYEHPFTVTNATKTIEIHLVSMHKFMKDVALAKDESELVTAVEKVNTHEIMIYKEFGTVFKRYLGNKKDIQKSYDAFVAWQPIREEVIALMKLDKKDEAASITKGKGAKHVQNLNMQVEKMIAFANTKAIYFKDNALKNEKKSIFIIVVTLTIILIIILSVLILLLKNISYSEKKLKEHLHLIDQNIMSAKSDKNCKIYEASNALSRHLGLSKEELLLTKEFFLFQDSSAELQSEIKRIIQSGKEWSGDILKLDSSSTPRWLNVKITPLFNDDFKVVAYTYILYDVSARKEIEKISRVDGLTNIYNRRFFDETFSKMIKIAHRQEKFLCFAMLDIDHFKIFNDTYGHQAGDVALKKVASTIKNSLKRPDDYSFRLGGEEFGMLFMVGDEEDGIEIANRVKVAVEKLKIAHPQNTASEFITISIGLYIIGLDNENSEEEIYAKCDEALYKAKEGGRNRIIRV